jgi:adenosine deaminase
VRWNAAFNRIQEEENICHEAQDLGRFLRGLGTRQEEISGVDLFSDEQLADALNSGQRAFPLIASYQTLNGPIHITMHAGELGDFRNVRDSAIFGAERVGHGAKLIDDPLTMEYVRTRGEPAIEVNLVSNVRLGVSPSFAEHPFLKFIRLGIKVAFSTDDEGIERTSINKEFTEMISNTDITYAEIKDAAFNSILVSFATENVKSMLIQKLTDMFTVFEKKWEGIARL